MNEILKIVLSLSLSGSLLILVLLLGKPLFKSKISKRWQYYIWLVVIARLLLPFTPATSPVGTLVQGVERAIVQTAVHHTSGQNTTPAEQSENGPVTMDIAISGEKPASVTLSMQKVLTILLQNLWLVWLAAALLLLIRKITIYQSFVKYMKAGRAEVSDTAILDRLAQIGEGAGITKPVELYTNSLISSPLLLGFFRPCIVFPTADLSDTDFQYTVLHELTHYKRRDMFYKWLVQIVICLHWFNPLVYVMGRDIGRACELACDEAVIRSLDAKGQRAYGDTLINAIGAGGNYKDALASVTLNESKELLKERLDAIMTYKKTSKVMSAVMVAVTFLMAAGAAAIGAYAKTQIPPATNSTDVRHDTPGNTGIQAITTRPISALADLEADSIKSITLTVDSCGIELIKSENGKFTFDYLGVNDAAKFKVNYMMAGDDVLQITADGTAARDTTEHYYIERGPNYSNVLRIGIPAKEYENIALTLYGAPAVLPDFDAAIRIEADDSSISLSDADISNGTYHINNLSGSVSITADTLSSNITVTSEGECELIFNQMPQNLDLDVSGCRGQVVLPAGWTKTYRLGNGIPTVRVSNDGYTEISIMN